MLCLVILVACATKPAPQLTANSSRSFQFTYSVDVESTDGKKLELWLPIPQSNEVQTISNLIINTNGIQHSIENEKIHGNKYLYINDENGITKVTNATLF